MTILDRTSRRAIPRIQTYPSERKRGARQITMNQLRLTVFGLTLIFCGRDASSNLAADKMTLASSAIRTRTARLSHVTLGSLQFERSGGQELSLYPSDRFTKASESSPTGLNLSFDGEKFPWFSNLPQLLAPEQDAVETFSGFAHNGGVLIRFRNHRLPTLPTNDESLTNDNLIWLDLSESPALPNSLPFKPHHR